MKKWAMLLVCLSLFLMTACGAGSKGASGTIKFPTKSIEFVAAGSPGGGLDLIARAVDQALTEAKMNDQPMIIKNLGGGGGNEAKAYINKQKGEPHFLYAESNRVYVNKIVGTTTQGIEAVTPIARMMTEYLVWVVKADSPYKSAKDILDKLKQDPASVEFGVGTIPSNDQLNILRPAMAVGVDPKKVRIIAFKSGGDLMAQLLGGHIPVVSTSASEALEQVKAGKARILAISAPQNPGGDFKDVPTWKSMNIDVSILHWRGLFAPPEIPQTVVKYWDDKLGKLVKTDAWKKTLEKYGWYDAYADSETFKKELQEEAKINEDLLKTLGLAK
jgi:putative tricarboxylic transport membrane protein